MGQTQSQLHSNYQSSSPGPAVYQMKCLILETRSTSIRMECRPFTQSGQGLSGEDSSVVLCYDFRYDDYQCGSSGDQTIMERLWTPWRMRYVSGETRNTSCIFCTKPESGDDVSSLILHRSERAYIIMNLYPYNSGHVMVIPFQHAADLAELPAEVNQDLWRLVPWATEALRRVLRCEGFNIGLNLGGIAGAGVSEHLHIHIVPRWEGDANFMPILAKTMVLPEMMPITYAKIRAEMEISALHGSSDGSGTVPQAGAIPVVPSRQAVALRRTADGSLVFPKGHIEAGEAAWQTAIREIDEEMGLNGIPAGWAGVLEFEHGGKCRRVANLILNAEPGPSFNDHLGTDTELYSIDDALDVLTHEPARAMLRGVRDEIEALMESPS
jgi:ATP adenylyltransferase